MSRARRHTNNGRAEIRTAAVGLAAAGLALFVSTSGPVRLIAGAVGLAGLLVMFWPRRDPSAPIDQPGKGQ